jgi:hypothetical protein
MYWTLVTHKTASLQKEISAVSLHLVASDLKVDWKYLRKKPFVTKGEKYNMIYFLKNLYKEKVL